jgi:hypothetical protein
MRASPEWAIHMAPNRFKAGIAEIIRPGGSSGL